MTTFYSGCVIKQLLTDRLRINEEKTLFSTTFPSCLFVVCARWSPCVHTFSRLKSSSVETNPKAFPHLHQDVLSLTFTRCLPVSTGDAKQMKRENALCCSSCSSLPCLFLSLSPQAAVLSRFTQGKLPLKPRMHCIT